MSQILIKTHKKGNLYKGFYFFILNKGLNSGKPLSEPCANCFVIFFTTQEEMENHYWVAFSLWQANFWHPYLVGSVIPFLRLPEFKSEFIQKADKFLSNYEKHRKAVQTLQLLELREKQFLHNINLINDARRVVLYRYIRSR